MSKEITKRDVVEAWLSNLCTMLDTVVWTDHEEWPEQFKTQVQSAYDYDLIDTFGTGFYYYFPDDSDIEALYPLIASDVL